MTRILLVCLGNICRSPAAEAVLRAKASDLTLDSAGTSDWHIGDAPYEPMQRAAMGRGLDMSDLRARQFIASDYDKFDLILGMDGKNLTDIEILRPQGSKTPVENFAGFAGAAEVPDPYYTRDFEGCLDLIERCADGLIRRLDERR